jgi:hypothetical protein
MGRTFFLKSRGRKKKRVKGRGRGGTIGEVYLGWQ